MKRTLFISDLHLEDEAPERTEWLLHFLSGPARDADAVYILGDLFEFWIGDDAPSQTARQVSGALAALTASGVRASFQHGNRDFMLGKAYASSAGLELLPEHFVVDLYGRPTLLLHGDTLCTDDRKYQAFRRRTRNRIFQKLVLRLSVDNRLRIAGKARSASKTHTAAASMEIMDVNADAVATAFREHGVTRMIHGHTHRPAHHRLESEHGTVNERIVLADWYRYGSYLEVTPDGVASITF